MTDERSNEQIISEALGQPWVTAADVVAALADADRLAPGIGAVLAERRRQIAKGYTPEHDDAHGEAHMIGWAIDYAGRGRTVEAAAMLLALNELRGRAAGRLVTPEHEGAQS